MFATCGKTRLDKSNLTHLRNLGQAIHAGTQPLVFDDGFVGLVDQRESEVNSNAEYKSRTGSKAGARQGRRASRRSRPPGQAKPFSSRATEEAHGAGFRLLACHYDALAVEAQDGLWVAVKSKPLGSLGPQAHFLIGAPNDSELLTMGWAFQAIGNKARPFPLKHTNFPDASICAFTRESGAWVSADGLLALADHYSLWAVKSWHRQYFGWWPGPQVGACALYRRKEFAAEEWCGCGAEKRYSDCHQGLDMVVSKESAQAEFMRLFRLRYEDRQLPTEILAAARACWKKLPAKILQNPAEQT